jgi:hypothetical protein
MADGKDVRVSKAQWREKKMKNNCVRNEKEDEDE